MTVLAASSSAFAQGPELQFGGDGPQALRWMGQDLLGDQNFAFERVVLERVDPGGKKLWGHSFEAGRVDSPRVEVDQANQRVVHRFPWGAAELAYKTVEGRLELTLTIRNTTKDRAIADFRARLIDLAFYDPQPSLDDEIVGMTLDRPYWYELQGPEKSKLFATCETFEVPVQFGFGSDRGLNPDDRSDRRGHRHSMIVLGGVPAMKTDQSVMPLLGVPHIPAGETLTLEFALRFAGPEQTAGSVLRPYLKGFREAQGEGLSWPDRRPIGRIDLQSSARHRTLMNPRGWFKSPGMDVDTEEGRAAFREKLMAVADRAIERMKQADAQGMVVWNLEGSHVPPAQPLGDPRLLSEIAPEMDAVADAFFKRFRDAGFKTGLTLRPSQLYFSDWRQRWTQGTGELAPEPDPFADQLKRAVPEGVTPERVYPLAERLSDKIAYAKRRWGCSIFYIHFNGMWWEPEPGAHREWMVASGRMIRRVREQHPDVLLIPQYVHRHWQSARASAIDDYAEKRPNSVLKELREREDLQGMYLPPPRPKLSLRGTGEYRTGGAPVSEWVSANSMYLRKSRRPLRRIIPGPRHRLRQSYWTHSAPYVDLKMERLIREFVLTLEQHMEYTREEAERIAKGEIAFETTPARVRDWMPDAFTMIDVTRAEIDPRRSQLQRAAAWGDVFMWSVDEDPTEVARLSTAAEAKKQRLTTLAEHVGIVEPGGDPLPLSLVWSQGESVEPERFVAGASASKGLRARVVYSGDRRKALLMLSWRGGTAEPVRLSSALRGIDVVGPHKRIWVWPSAAAGHTRDAFLVNPDPVAGLNTILVESADAPAETAPEGLVLAAPFDQGLAPAIGGGPRQGANLEGRLVDGRSGKGLRVDRKTNVGFGVAPDWFGGTVEFDIKAMDVGDGSLPVLSMKHHLDVTLSLERQAGGVGIALNAAETKPNAEEGQAGASRKAFAMLRGGANGWHHVLLTWEIGQYTLYINGRKAATAFGPITLRRRDAAVFEPGVILGGGNTASEAAAVIDGLAVYDWPFAEETAAGRKTGGAVKPIARPEKKLVGAWLWGSMPEQLTVAVNARRVDEWTEVAFYRVTLYRMEDMGRRQIGHAELATYNGVAIGTLPFKVAENLDVQADGGGGPALDGAGEDDLGMLGEELGLEKDYVLEIQPMPEGEGPPPRSIKFSSPTGDGRVFHW